MKNPRRMIRLYGFKATETYRIRMALLVIFLRDPLNHSKQANQGVCGDLRMFGHSSLC